MLAYAAIYLVIIVLAYTVIAIHRDGYWITLAEVHDDVFGLPDTAETKERLITLQDCMVKAVAQQPLGRPINPLWNDLRSACAYEIAFAKRGLIIQHISEGKPQSSDDEVWDEIRPLLHPIIERAQPVRLPPAQAAPMGVPTIHYDAQGNRIK
jgi:hypothetical protein